MRTFVMIVFIFTASFGTPLFANADTSCTGTDSTGQTVTGILVNGVCSVATNPPSNVTPGNPPSNTTPPVTLINPLQGGTSLESFLGSILTFVIRIGAIVVVLMLVYIGYLFVVAQGEPAKLTEAKKALLWTIIGALVLLGAVAIKDGIIATVQALSVGQ